MNIRSVIFFRTMQLFQSSFSKNLFILFFCSFLLIFFSVESKSQPVQVGKDFNMVLGFGFCDNIIDPAAVGKTTSILLKRIVAYGVSIKNVKVRFRNGNLFFYFKDLNDPDEMKMLLEPQGKFEIRETYEAKDVIPLLTKADQLYSSDKSEWKDKKEIAEKTELMNKLGMSDTKRSSDGTDPENQRSQEETKAGAVGNSGMKEDNPLFSYLRLAIETDENEESKIRKGPVVGFAQFNNISRIDKYLSLEAVKALFPEDLKLCWSAKPIDKSGKIYELIAVRVKNTGQLNSAEANVISDAYVNDKSVIVNLDSGATDICRQLTHRNIEKNISILLDDKVFMYPVVTSVIPNGKCEITGGLGEMANNVIVSILKCGTLPKKIKLSYDRF